VGFGSAVAVGLGVVCTAADELPISATCLTEIASCVSCRRNPLEASPPSIDFDVTWAVIPPLSGVSVHAISFKIPDRHETVFPSHFAACVFASSFEVSFTEVPASFNSSVTFIGLNNACLTVPTHVPANRGSGGVGWTLLDTTAVSCLAGRSAVGVFDLTFFDGFGLDVSAPAGVGVGVVFSGISEIGAGSLSAEISNVIPTAIRRIVNRMFVAPLEPPVAS
jgi:hypothetical protein